MLCYLSIGLLVSLSLYERYNPQDSILCIYRSIGFFLSTEDITLRIVCYVSKGLFVPLSLSTEDFLQTLDTRNVKVIFKRGYW